MASSDQFKPHLIDDIIADEIKQERFYRRYMFWNFIATNIRKMGSTPEFDEFIEAIFLFKSNPESAALLKMIQDNGMLPEENSTAEELDPKWSQALAAFPFVFLLIPQRVMQFTRGDNSRVLLSMRMDALYGIDWVLHELPQVVRSSSLLQFLREPELRGAVAKMFSDLALWLEIFVKVPDDLSDAEKADVALADELGRERRVALEVLGALLDCTTQLGLQVNAPATAYTYIANHLDLYYPRSKRQFLAAEKQLTPEVKALDQALLKEALADLQTAHSNNFATKVDNETGEKAYAAAKTPGPHYYVGSLTSRNSVIVPSWTPAADGSGTLQKEYYEVEYAKFSEVAEITKAIGQWALFQKPETKPAFSFSFLFAPSAPPTTSLLETAMPLLEQLLRNPVSPGLRQNAFACLVHANPVSKEAILKEAWNVAKTGPRCFPTTKCDLRLGTLIAQFSFSSLYPSVDYQDLADCFFSEPELESTRFVEMSQRAFASYLADAVIPCNVGAIPKQLLKCIPPLLKATIANPTNTQFFDMLTDYVKRGGKQLEPFARDITAAYLAMLEVEPAGPPLYGIGLWLGKVAEGEFLPFDDVIQLGRKILDEALNALAAFDASATKDDPMCVVAIYALQRCICYLADFHKKDAPTWILAMFKRLPLHSASNGDVIALSVNSRAVDILGVDFMPKNNEQIKAEVARFLSILTGNPGTRLVGDQEYQRAVLLASKNR